MKEKYSLLKPKEVADILGISRDAVYRLLKKKTFKAMWLRGRKGGHIRIFPESVDEYKKKIKQKEREK